MKIKINIGEMAEALAQLRKEQGYLLDFNEREILDRAIVNKQMQIKRKK